MSDEEWDLVIAVHLRGHFLLTRNAATYWRAKAKDAGGSVFGRIVNTSSEAGLAGPIGQANYGAAKAGIISLTLTAARALGRYGVCANAICPRARTAMTADVFGAARYRGRADRPVVARARGQSGPVPVVPGGRRGQRSGVHRLRPTGDVGGGADRGASVQRGRRGLGARATQFANCKITLLGGTRKRIFPQPASWNSNVRRRICELSQEAVTRLEHVSE